MNPNFLAFVEDPGAANYLAPVVAGLQARGATCRFFAGTAASEYLRDRGVSVEMLPADASARALLDQVRPRVLLAGTSENPDAFGLALIDAARSLTIPSVAAVDGAANSTHRFRGRGHEALAHAPDWILVSDACTKESYVALGIAADHVVVCGHPHYDVVYAARRALEAEGHSAVRARVLPVARERRVVVFVSEISGGLDAEQFRRSDAYTLQGHGSEGRTEIVLDELIDAIALGPTRPFLVLRLHPKNTPDDYPRHAPAFDELSQGGSPLDLVFAADLVVGMTSMLLLEAALLGRPTLAIVPRRLERDWLPSIGWGVTACVHERAALRAQLAFMLDGPSASGVPPTTGVAPQGSTDLVVSFLGRCLR